MTRQHRRDAAAPTTHRICLAMLLRDDASTLPACLRSVRRFVSSYLVFDCGSTDGSGQMVTRTLDGLPGSVVGHDAQDVQATLAEIYRLASRDATHVLFLDAHEVLACVGEPGQHLDDDIVFLEVEHGLCSFLEPRLLRSGHGQLICDPFRCEQDIDPHLSSSTARHARLFYQVSPTTSTPTFLQTGRQRAIVECPRSRRNAVDGLLLAVAGSRRGDLAAARAHLHEGLASHPSPAIEWLLRYLLARALLDDNDHGAAMTQLALCCELDPDRVEALYQLAKLKRACAETDTAIALARLALEPTLSPTRHYFERRVYEHDRYAFYIDVMECHRRHADLLRDCDELLADDSLGLAARDMLRHARQRQARALTRVATDGEPGAARPLLTIGMATFDDYDGVYFTLTSLRLHHPACLDDTEFLVVDNHPEGPSGSSVRTLCETLGVRYLPVSDYRSTAVRDTLFRHARGDFVLCLDCHVLLLPGAIDGLLAYLRSHRRCADLLQGPLVNDTGERQFSHLAAEWRDGLFGRWAETGGLAVDSPPFEIEMQGLGLFCCRRQAWPGLNPRFAGFGGEEGYLHEKFRRNGARVLCLPFLRWAHRFGRPLGVPYPLDWAARIRNYLVGFDELRWDTENLARHFSETVGFGVMSAAWTRFQVERETSFYRLDAIYWLDHGATPPIRKEMERRFEQLGFAHRVRRVACAAGADRFEQAQQVFQLLDRAVAHGYREVLVIQHQALLAIDLERSLRRLLHRLDEGPWSLCLLDDDHGDGASHDNPNLRTLDRVANAAVADLLTGSSAWLARTAGVAAALPDWRQGLVRSTMVPTAEQAQALPNAKNAIVHAASPPLAMHRHRLQEEERPARFCSVDGI